MTQLHWFPLDVEEWEKLTEALTLEESGALLHVAVRAWRDPEAPATIADGDAALERLLGARWKRLAPAIRERFTPDPEHPSRLRWVWLSELYTTQLTKYQNKAFGGSQGGKAKARNIRARVAQPPSNASSNATSKRTEKPVVERSNASALLAQIEDGGMKPLTGLHHPPGADGARGAALTGAAAPAPEIGEKAAPPPEWRELAEQIRASCAADEAERAARAQRRSLARRTSTAFVPLGSVLPPMATVSS